MSSTRSAIERLTRMIGEVNNFCIELRKGARSVEDARALLVGLHADFVMLGTQIHSDHLNALRAQNIGNCVTPLLVSIGGPNQPDLNQELSNIQLELTTLQMVLEASAPGEPKAGQPGAEQASVSPSQQRFLNSFAM